MSYNVQPYLRTACCLMLDHAADASHQYYHIKLHCSYCMALERTMLHPTDKPSQGWIGDWWEGCGFACLAWCLASDVHRLTRLTQTHILVIVSLMLAQIHSVSFRCIHSHPDWLSLPRSTQSHSDLLWLTQILAISHRFAQLHAVSLRIAQIQKKNHTVSSRFT